MKRSTINILALAVGSALSQSTLFAQSDKHVKLHINPR